MVFSQRPTSASESRNRPRRSSLPPTTVGALTDRIHIPDQLPVAEAATPALQSSWPGPTVRRLLRVLGPAWIVMLADVDAPSVLTAAKAGTDFGYAILLPVVALIPVLYPVQEMTA
jgi:hypothetical protein